LTQVLTSKDTGDDGREKKEKPERWSIFLKLWSRAYNSLPSTAVL
jgi:hypothetical protein